MPETFILPDQVSETFTVQQEPLQTINYPLPTEYWTRPIEGQNTNWYTIASNWLGPVNLTNLDQLSNQNRL